MLANQIARRLRHIAVRCFRYNINFHLDCAFGVNDVEFVMRGFSKQVDKTAVCEMGGESRGCRVCFM